MLFLAPEYLGKVNMLSFFFTGLATGSFIMAFHISSYVVMAHQYPFIVRFTKPFYHYSVNNSTLPLLYICIYVIQSYRHQKIYELLPWIEVYTNLLAFLAGLVLFIFFSFGFFYLVSRGIPKLVTIGEQTLNESEWFKPRFLKRIYERDADKKMKESPFEAEDEDQSAAGYYLSSFFRISRTGRFSHFSRQSFKKVFQYQHIHAISYVVFMLILILTRGFIKDKPSLMLPAGASFHIIFTVIVLITSLFYLIFRNWTVVVMGLFIFLISYFSPPNLMSYNNSAYGMNYSNHKSFPDLVTKRDFFEDSLNTIKILGKWKLKNTDPGHPHDKPRMILITADGGGLKMAVWTYYALGYVDSVLEGQLIKHTQRITGASGGMLGAAYFRENYLEFS